MFTCNHSTIGIAQQISMPVKRIAACLSWRKASRGEEARPRELKNQIEASQPRPERLESEVLEQGLAFRT